MRPGLALRPTVRLVEVERVQARTLPRTPIGDAAQLTLLMAQAMGRPPSIAPRRAADLYRRPVSDAPILSILA